LQALQRELKLYEVCVRIVEQECVQAIIDTKKEVQSSNIDAMLNDEQRQSSLSTRNQLSSGQS